MKVLEGKDLDGAQIQGGELGRLEGCSLQRAHLRDVRVLSLRNCDLRGATLERCDLRSADLRGCRLDGALLRACQLDGVQAQGCTLRDCVLSPSARQHVLAGGGGVEVAEGDRRLRRWAPRLRWAALLLLPLTLLALLPPKQAAPGPNPEDYRPPPDAEARTQENLARLRAGLSAAHEQLRRHPGRHWPTLDELQANHYDLDGDGPGQALGILVPGGLPRNLLSAAEGSVLPYCNEVPDQATLTGVDTDWHYCPENGRVFASAALTDAPTLSW